MASSTPVGLFATKGLEYLLVIGFLAALVFFWRILNRPARGVLAAGAGTRPALAPAEWFRLVPSLFYHPGHTWAMPEGGDVVRVGVDDFAQKLIGKTDRVALPNVGDRIEQGGTAFRLKADQKSVGVLAPVSGEVVARNQETVEAPERLNEDPYGRGWLIRVRVPRLNSNLKNLLRGNLARAWMNEVENGLRRRMAGELGVAYQDGSLLLPGIAKNLSLEHWDAIAAEFLLSG